MSGRLVGGVVGAVIGGYFGNAQLGWMIGSAVGGYVDPDVVQGPRLTDAGQQFSQDGVALTWGFGTFPTSGNVIWRQETIDEVRHKESSKGGPVQVTYTYHRSYAIGVCQGPIDGFLQIKRNGKIVFDARTDAELLALGYSASTIKEIRAASSKFMEKCTLYLGDESQLPDPVIESFEGVGNVAPFHGLAYIAVEADDLTESAGAIPQYEFVVSYNGEAGTSSFSEYDVAEYSRFSSIEDLPLLNNPETDYTYISNVSGVGSRAESSLSEAIAYGVANESMPGDPTVLVGFLKAGAGPWSPSSVPMIGHGTTDTLEDDSYIWLCYQWRTPELVHDDVWIVGEENLYTHYDGDTTSWRMDSRGYFFRFTSASTMESFAPVAIQVFDERINPSDQPLPGEMPVPDAPGWYVNEMGDLRKIRLCGEEPIAGSFLVLALESMSGDLYIQRELGPVLPAGSPASTEEYWTASYEYARDNGDVPAGWTYDAEGDGGDGTYPRTKSSAYQCDVVSGVTLDRNRILLAEVDAEIFRRSGLASDEYDVSQLTDVLDGYRIATEGNGEAFTAPTMPAYFYDSTEHDGKIRCIKRGDDPVATITPDDFAERDGDAVEWERIQEPELLRKQTVAYLSPRAGFTRMTQQAERRSATVRAIGEATVEIPVVMSDDEAAQVAEKRIKVAWTEPEKCYFSLPYKFSYLTPCDVIWLNDGERTRRMRITRIEEDSGVLICEASMDRQSAYVSNAKGTATNPPIIVTPGLIGPTNAVIMNLPVLRETDDEAGLYVAIAGYLSGWEGAELLFSTDDGATYQTAETITSKAVIGYTLTELLPEVSSEYLSHQSVTIFLPEAPESLSYEAMLRYGNRAVIDGEVLQYQTVTTVDATTFILSGLVRGRHNTAPVGHASGARFVLFDDAVIFVPTPSWMIGRALKYKAVSIGTSADSYEGLDYSYTSCISQTEFSPTFVQAERDGSDNVTVTWIGRGRIGAEVAPRHSKYFVGYRITYSDGTTFDVGTSVTTHTRSSAPVSQTITVRGLNAITGAGQESEEVFA